jgi:glycosyltransferase involved in cell wall biosynthesis
MKVSVVLLAFNHAQFFVQSIESALAQKTDFEFEVVVGEDESSDGTREIVEDYVRRFPGKVRGIYGRRADVHTIHGQVTGRRNYYNSLIAAKGQYIAMLDGDDFWESTDKLQQQADYMDGHPECSVCGTDAWIETSADRSLFSQRFWKKPGTVFTLEDILAGDFIPPTVSVLLRRSVLEFPPVFWETITGDMAVFSICGTKGNFAVIPEPMSVYRVHSGGIYTGGRKPGERTASTPTELRRLQKIALMFEDLRSFLGAQYADVLEKRLSGIHRDIAWVAREIDDAAAVRQHSRAALSYAKYRGPHLRELLKLWLGGVAPWLLRFKKQKL